MKRLSIRLMRTVLMSAWLISASVGLLAACKSSDSEKLWGIYQEPIEPQALLESTGVVEIKTLWKKNLGRGAANGYAILKPAYGADGIYAASRSSVFKLNPSNGATLWRRDLGADIFSGVGVGESIAVVALDNGNIVALNATSGGLLWETPLHHQISAIPVVGKGRVVARAANGLVVGLDADDGAIAWSFDRTPPGLSIHGDSTPVINGDAVFIGLANGKLLANNIVTGRAYWETEVSLAKGRNELERLIDSDAAPLVSANTLYTATYQGHVAALELQNAAIQWKADISSRLPMSLGDGQLLVTSELGEIVAINAESGAILWTQAAFIGRGMSRPLAQEERILVGDSSGNIYSLDPKDGVLLERRKAVSGAIVGLVPGENQFAVFSSEGDLSALSLNKKSN